MAVAELDVTLDQLRETISKEHGLVIRAKVATVSHAILAGEALIRARNLVPRGEWQDYLAATVGRADTARVYMRLARHRRELEWAGVVGVDQAIRYLASPRETTALNPVLREKAAALSESGLTTRQIARELEVSAASAWRLVNPAKDKHSRRQTAAKMAAARRSLERQERDQAVRRVGGPLAEAYAQIRRTLQVLESARGSATIEGRVRLESAMDHLYAAEDEIGHAVREA